MPRHKGTLLMPNGISPKDEQASFASMRLLEDLKAPTTVGRRPPALPAPFCIRPFHLPCCASSHVVPRETSTRGHCLSPWREAVQPFGIISSMSLFCRPASPLIRETVVLGPDARRSTAVTCTGIQMPPRAVATPRALSALAMARNDVAPLAFICSMTGSTLAAKRSAFALLEAMQPLVGVVRLGLRPAQPYRLASDRQVFSTTDETAALQARPPVVPPSHEQT